MKKQSLVTNQRDKNLLVVLAVCIIVYVCYSFVINPALQNGDALKLEVASAQEQLAATKDVVAQYPTLKQEELKLKPTLIEKYKLFFYDLNQERILYRLDSLVAGSGFSVTAYTPTPPVAAPITALIPQYVPLTYPLLDLASKANPSLVPQTSGQPESAPAVENTSGDAVDSQADTAAAEGQVTADAIPTTDITLGFTQASYEGAMAFLKSLENMDKSVIVKNISFTKTEMGVDGQIVLSVYSLPQLDDSTKDLLKFLPVIPQGKANPFN